VPDKTEVHTPIQNFWFSAENFFHVTLLAPIILRWFLGFW